MVLHGDAGEAGHEVCGQWEEMPKRIDFGGEVARAVQRACAVDGEGWVLLDQSVTNSLLEITAFLAMRRALICALSAMGAVLVTEFVACCSDTRRFPLAKVLAAA